MNELSRGRPKVRVVVLNGTDESGAARIPRGTHYVAFQTRSTTDLRVAFATGDTQIAGRFFQLTGGQGFVFEEREGFEDDFDMFFFAAAAETVDVVFW